VVRLGTATAVAASYLSTAQRRQQKWIETTTVNLLGTAKVAHQVTATVIYLSGFVAV
jgi:hypothetical protein